MIPKYNAQDKLQIQRQTEISTELNKPVDFSEVKQFSNQILAKRKNINDSTWSMKQAAQAQQDMMTEFANAKDNIGEDPTGFAESLNSKLSSYNDRILATAPSPEARVLLERQLLQTQSYTFADAFSYEIGLQNEKRKREFSDALELNKNTLLHRPEKFQSIYDATFDSEFWNALPAPQRAELESKVKEDLAVAALTGQLNQIDSGTDIDTKLKLYTQLKDDLDSGAYDQYLPFETQAKANSGMSRQIEAVRKDIEQRKKESVAMDWQFIQASLDDHEQSIIQTGVPVISRDRVALIAREMDNPMLLKEYDEMTRNAKNLHSVMNSIDLSNPQEASKKIENLMPTPGDPEYNSKFKTYSSAKNFYDSNIKAIISDPAQYASSKNSVKQAYSRSEKEGILANIAVQSKFGLPSYAQKILTSEQATGMVKQINSLPPDQIEKYFTDMKQRYGFSIGGGITAYDKIFQELHTLPSANRLSGNYSVLASVVGTPVANDLIKAIKQGPELKTALPAGVSYDNVLGAVKGNLSGFAKSFSVGDSSSADLSNIYSATTNLAMQYLNSGKASNYVDAAKMASKNLILDNYSVIPSPKNNRYSYYIPKNINGQVIDSNKVQRFLKEKQNIKDLNNFVGSNYFGDVNKVIPKNGETKVLTYYADNYISTVNKKLGTQWQVISRVRPANGVYKSLHETGEAVDLGRAGHTEQQSYDLLRRELNNPLVKSIGTSDPELLAAFKGNPKLKDMRSFDGQYKTNHKDHFHISLNTSLGEKTFGQYANNQDEFADTMKAVANTGFWRTNTTGTGAYLMYQNPKTGNYSKVYNPNGQLYEFNFKNISRGTL